MLHSTVLKIVLAIVLFFLILFISLAHGIRIDRLDLPGLKISEFYIKLDKKLIVEIDKVIIGSGKKKHGEGGAVEEMDRIGGALRFIPALFEKVQINRAVIGGEQIATLFYDDLFYVETDRLQLATRLDFDEKRKVLYANVRFLHVEGPDLTLRGEFAYDTRRHIWNGEGSYRGLNLDGNFSVWHKGRTIGFEVNANPTDSIKPLIDYIDPIPPIKVWIYPNIPAKRYILHYLKGTVTLKKGGGIDFDPYKVEASASAYDAKVHFHPKVPPVKVARIDVTLKNDTLAFHLHKPVYERKRLDGSFVRIRNLIPRRGQCQIDIHIVANAPFDRSVRKVLQAFNIPLPFVQTAGTAKSRSDITLRIADGSLVKYRGDYRIKKGTLLFLDEIPVPVENLHVTAEDQTITIAQGGVVLPPYLEANLKGKIDFKKHRGEFRPTIRRLSYGPVKAPLLSIKNESLHVVMDFEKLVRFSIPSLKTDLAFLPRNGIRLEMEDLARLKPYLKGPLKGIESGSLILTRTPGLVKTDAQLVYRNNILFRQGKPWERFSLQASLTPDKRTLTLGDRLRIEQQKETTTVTYHDLDIQLFRLKKMLTSIFAQDESKKRTKKAKTRFIHIYGKKSRLLGQRAYLPCDSLEGKITLAKHFSALFESRSGNGTIHAIVVGDGIKIVGRKLPDRVVHGIPALKDLYGGYYNFDAVGKIDDFNGTVTIYDALWAKSAVYNNLIATLNAIPSLLTMQNPGFNKDGFKIKKGFIRYRYKAPLFDFEKIAIEGASANIYGKGHINFDTHGIDMKMRIQFMESISKTMHNVPVAGYILFGKDGTISVGLSVSGTLEKPKVKTSAAKDIVTAPINILKRTITFPFHLFD